MPAMLTYYGFSQCSALYKSTFYSLTYLFTKQQWTAVRRWSMLDAAQFDVDNDVMSAAAAAAAGTEVMRQVIACTTS